MALITVREALRDAMSEEMARDGNVFVIGEEVAEYQGAYKVTQGLLDKFGPKRVIDSPITEQGFAGLAVGAALGGLRPIVEFMTMNFSMQAIDQIINSAAKTRYMSGGLLSCPIVFRGPNGAALRVGAQHSQCYASWYGHIPGLIVISPYTAADHKSLLKAAIRDDNPVVFLENEKMYGRSDEMPENGEEVAEIGKAAVLKSGDDVTIISFSIQVGNALAAAEALKNEGIDAEIIDLRTIRPLDIATIIASIKKTNKVIAVEESWPFAGICSEIAAIVMENAFDYLDAPLIRVTGKDVPMPYAANLEKLSLPQVYDIVDAAKYICNKNKQIQGWLVIAGMINKTPVASRVLHVHGDCHGERRDYYHWLRDPSWPQVRNQKILDYLTAENDYADSQISHGVTELLFQEMKDRIQEEDFTVPYLDGGYYYYSEIKKGQQYWTHKRKKSLDAQSAEILVDENILAIDHEYLKVGAIKVSPNQKLVAYTLDVAGSERYTLYIKDISADITIDAGVSDLMANIEWDAGSTGIFYTPAGKFWRSESIYFHRVGSDVAQDKLLYHENEATFSVYFRKSNSKKYIFFASKSSNSSEVYFINSAEPTAVPKLIAARTEGHIYSPEHHGDFFYIRTNDISPNFRIVRVAIDNPSQHQWQSYIGDSEEYIKELITYRDHLVVVSKRHGLAVIKVIALSDFSIKELEFADSTYEVSVEFTTFDAVSLRYKYSSLNTPLTVFEHHFDTSDLSTLKIQEFSSRFALKDYVLERIWAESDDGVKVPVSIFYHSQQVKLDGSAPLYLYGYGSYGLAVPDHFRTTIFSLVDRGFVYAIAHIRGGDELGKQWHEDAKFLTKKSTFIDFICVAETLIAQKYTSAKQIVIHGGSAGGMLVGCCINMRPDLYHAAIAEVPFVDVLSTMLDDTLPLTPYEFKEWGNPKEALYYEYMQSYSPYDNVEAKDYPHLLVTAGLADPRVGYWEPAKWVALLRYLKTDNNLLLLKTEMGAGHGGPSGRFDYLKEIAVNYAFILKVFGRDEYAPEQKF